MRITTCYTVPIQQQMFPGRGEGSFAWRPVDGALMKSTSDLCLEALRCCADIFLKEWGYLSSLPVSRKAGRLSRKRAADLLVHSTRDNEARYPGFDGRFPYMPAYTRRAVVADALGMVSSYMSNRARWEALPPGGRGREPVIGYPSRYELTFYDQERDLCDIEKGIISLKLYDGHAWGWHRFRVRASDAKYIARMKAARKMLSPVVEKVRGRYRIRFSFAEDRALVSDEDPLGYRVLAVDLGINAPASWCVMTADGTVHARGVIRLGCEEDRLRRLINRKRMYQQAGKRPKSIYRMVTGANRALSIETCRAVIDKAALYGADCIVFEHLDRKGRVRGRGYRERIHMWRAEDVQRRVEVQAHRHGMRVSRVCAWGTSRLAFDGSGPVTRDKGNFSICTFADGKRYNCDLSASQNIGARYFLRLLAEEPGCPEMPATPKRTYATLLTTVRVMASA